MFREGDEDVLELVSKWVCGPGHLFNCQIGAADELGNFFTIWFNQPSSLFENGRQGLAGSINDGSGAVFLADAQQSSQTLGGETRWQGTGKDSARGKDEGVLRFWGSCPGPEGSAVGWAEQSVTEFAAARLILDAQARTG